MWAFRVAATTASAAILMMGYQVLKVHRSRLHRAAAKTIEPVESPDETGPRFVATVRTGSEDDVDHQATAAQGRPTGTASIHGTILGLATDVSELSLGAQAAGRHYAADVAEAGHFFIHRQGCPESSSGCLLDNLPVTPHAEVRIFRRDCIAKPASVVLNPGRNYLGVDCERVKQIAGVVRAAQSGDLVTPKIAVRCTPDGLVQNRQGFSFSLDCPANLDAIEYRDALDRTWRPAPIRSSSDGTRGLVDIQLL